MSNQLSADGFINDRQQTPVLVSVYVFRGVMGINGFPSRQSESSVISGHTVTLDC